jgi:hypothetical protein
MAKRKQRAFTTELTARRFGWCGTQNNGRQLNPGVQPNRGKTSQEERSRAQPHALSGAAYRSRSLVSRGSDRSATQLPHVGLRDPPKRQPVSLKFIVKVLVSRTRTR